MSLSSRSIIDNVVLPRSALYQGRFGRMFRSLPKWAPPLLDSDPDRLPDNVVVDRLRDFASNEMSETSDDALLDNTNIPAGYTYFGQFVDHDITFDPTSSLQRENDPNKLNNFRTPRLDLDCIYGTGPDDEPFMYDKNRGGMFLIGNVKFDKDGSPISNSSEPDLPRNEQGIALIGDKRNDENVIVSQLQLSMLRLHNRVLANLMFGVTDVEDVPSDFGINHSMFREAQRIVRWFYQYVVWNDWVRRLIKDDFWSTFLELKNGVYNCNNRFYKWKHQPFMPVEFSVSAYRFGHSLVRPGYQINLNTDANVGLGFGVERPIFNPDGSGVDDLHGFRHFPHKHTVQWDWFFNFESSSGPFPQSSRRIDPKLASSVFKTPEGPGGVNHLGFLNLLRSWRIGLPKGTAVARAMGFDPIAINDEHENILWHYILKEAKSMVGVNSGKMLGNVGGTIVGEVFAGLLYGDPQSYVRIDPRWKPDREPVLMEILAASGGSLVPENPVGRAAVADGRWEVADLLRGAGAPINDTDVASTISNGKN